MASETYKNEQNSTLSFVRFVRFVGVQGWLTRPTSSPELDLPKEAPLTEWGIAKNLPSILLSKSKLGFAAVGVSTVAPTAQTR